MTLHATPRTTIVIKQVSEHFIGAVAFYDKGGRIVQEELGKVRRYDQQEVDRFIRRFQLYSVNNLFAFHIKEGIYYSMFYGDHLQVRAQDSEADRQEQPRKRGRPRRVIDQKTARTAVSKSKPVVGVAVGIRHKKAQVTMPGALEP